MIEMKDDYVIIKWLSKMIGEMCHSETKMDYIVGGKK